MNRCLFYFPSKNVGGAELLIFRLAKELNQLGKEIWIIDYEDGYVPRSLSKDGIPFSLIRFPFDGKSKYSFDFEDLLFLTHFHILDLPKLSFLGDLKVLVCEIHKGIWHRLQQKMAAKLPSVYYSIWQRPFQDLINRKSLCILERDSLLEIEKCKISGMTGKNIMPIPINCGTQRPPNASSSCRHVVSIGWDHPRKIIPAGWAFQEISELYPGRFLFSYVCRDPSRSKVIFENHYPQIAHQIQFLSLAGDGLDSFMYHNCHIYVGKGTSLLEAGRIGIPSLILDGGTGPIPPGGRVRHLFKNNLQNLGTAIPSLTNGLLISAAINEILTQYAAMSDLTYNYVKSFHSTKSVVQQFVTLGEESRLCLSDSKRVKGLQALRLLSYWKNVLGFKTDWNRY